LLAAVLAFSGRVKLTNGTARRRAASSALGTLVGKERAPAVYGALGAVEAGAAALLLAGGLAAAVPGMAPLQRAAAALSTALALGFLGYLGYVRAFAPDSSCGCMSARQAPVTWRSFGRAGLLLAADVLALASGVPWPRALAAHPAAGV